MHIPTCCGEIMLVQAGGVFACDACGETLTRAEYENREQSRAERAFERSLNADNAPSDAAYRQEMKDAGRGHLL